MIVAAVEKQPGESFVIAVDFALWLASGETINAGPVVTSKNVLTGADSSASLLSGSATVSGSQVRQRVVAATDGDRHRIQFRIVTSAANTYEAEVDVAVREY